MDYRLQLVTAPGAAAGSLVPLVEPLSVGGGDKALDIFTHVTEADSTDDVVKAHLGALIRTARLWCEHFVSRHFIDQTWDVLLPGGFPSHRGYIFRADEIRLPRAPLKQSGGIVSVKYLDTDGAQQTLTAGTQYVSTVRGDMAVILPAYNESWPSVRVHPDSSGNFPVEVRCIFGYGAVGSNVPEPYRAAMALLVYHWYRNREAVSDTPLSELPAYGVDALLWMDRFYPW